eukprot:CAMPEP_0172319284 /NCGR_PEP_ID=MMETSP1058-20130122/37272_1 /TAXON_ID=83371 /ORGANISM="Detonula confervacea, Strain CCMP 353" /LENGTH=514 /DNA_ID=CAMNT_0013034291 /DNA_START=93 /DNA_END=1634 /DNA_ORIENTATION=+
MPAAKDADEDPNASFYGEDIFDDLIAKAMDSTAGGGTGPSKLESGERVVVEGTPANLENPEVGGRGDDFSSTGGSDVASLGSEEISGESDVSEEEEQEQPWSYAPSPLVNDDESTIDMRPPAPNNQTVSSYVDQLNRSERSKGRLIKAGSFAICIAIIVGVVLAVISLTGNNDEGNNSSGSSQVSTSGFPAPADQTSNLIPAPEIIPAPTMKPVVAAPTETVHPVLLTFQNIPAGYRLPDSDRTSIISFIGELIGDHLDDSFELLEVAYARGSAGGRNRSLISRRLESFSLPLRIVLRGPSNFSQDFVRSYVIEKIQERSNNIVNYLKAFNWNTFNSVRISAVETYDMFDLIEPTASPSLPPQTRQPTTSPSLPYRTGEPSTSPSSSPLQSPTQPPITEPPVTNKPTTRAPVTNKPTNKRTKNPTRKPTWYPTSRPTPTTPSPTPRPSLRPTRRPTNKPVTTIIAPYGAAANNNPSPSSPTPAANGSVNQGPVSIPSGASNGYFCAETSYTANW